MQDLTTDALVKELEKEIKVIHSKGFRIALEFAITTFKSFEQKRKEWLEENNIPHRDTTHAVIYDAFDLANLHKKVMKKFFGDG